ncbi:MAG TPA: hypothetical protein VFZ04_22745 [Longimicrobiales bacterium]
MNSEKLDLVRESVLTQMERADRGRQYAIIAAALCELLFGSAAMLLMDWSDRQQIAIFLLFIMTYTVTGLGLIALGAHISNNASRVIAAIESVGDTQR